MAGLADRLRDDRGRAPGRGATTASDTGSGAGSDGGEGGDPPDPEDALPRMTLAEHLDELRRRLVRSVLALLLGMIVAFLFYKRIFAFALAPYREAVGNLHAEGDHLVGLGPAETFLQIMKLCFIAGLVGTAPYVLTQMWGFIAAGLYPHERRAVRVFFPVSLALFFLGCLCAYLVLLPIGLQFLIAFSKGLDVGSNFAVGQYLSLCIGLVFWMGVAFQLPLVMLFLQATGIVERSSFTKSWRIAVLAAFVLAMIFTADPSPVSQVLMATPLVGLYFLGVWGGRFVGEGRVRFTVWKAWPLAIAVLAMVAIFWFRRDLTRWTADLWR